MPSGGEIKRLRTKSGNSAAEVASWIGVDAERLRKWESRDVDPKDPDDKRKVEKYFNRKLSELKGLESFDFYVPGYIPPINEMLALRATVKVLSQEVAKLQAKVYKREVNDCLEELENNTTLLLRELYKGEG